MGAIWNNLYDIILVYVLISIAIQTLAVFANDENPPKMSRKAQISYMLSDLMDSLFSCSLFNQ